MGCSSEMGCLGPKPREREVYVDLIETMHSQVTKMTLSTNGDAYKQIRDRLLKKGLLRKLIDNLVSHKAHIYDCLNQNFEVISQTSLAISRIAGLVITDKIMEELRKQHRSSDNIDEYLSKNKSMHQVSQNYKHLNEASMGVNQSSSPLGLELDHRLDLLYFRFMLFLLENQESMYKEILSSINKFVSHRKEKLSCKAEIFKIFEMLIGMMKRGKQMEESSTTFAIILEKVKQNLRQESTDSDNITFILKAIVSHGDKSNKVSEFTLDNFKDILGIYFSRYFGQFEVLFNSILKIFDELSFEQTGVSKIEETIIAITKAQDIYLPFIRGLFVQLQGYLQKVDNHELKGPQSIKQSDYKKAEYKNIYSQISKLNAFRLLSRWVLNGNIEANETIAYNSSALVSPYVINILHSNSQGFIFEVKREFFKVVSSLSTKSTHIIIDYLIEEIKDMHRSDKVRGVMLNLIKEILNIKVHSTPEESLNNLSFIFPVEKYFGLEIKIQILQIAKTLFKNIKYQYISRNSEANQTLKTKICAFFYSLHQNVIDQQNIPKQDCQFLGMTASRRFTNSQQSQRQRYFILAKNRFVQQIFQFLKCLISQHLHILVIPYLESINDSFLSLDNNWKRDQDIIITFFLLSLLYRGLMDINKSERVPEQLMKINLKLQDSMVNLSIKQEIISWVQKSFSLPSPIKQLGEFEGLKIGNSLDPLISSFVQANRKKIGSARQFSMLSSQQYAQMIEYYKEFFRSGPLSTGRNEDQSPRTDMKHFNRSSSVNVTLDEIYSQKNSAKMEGEESFRDILERIHEV